jgi:flagellar biogenesis protein FliO
MISIDREKIGRTLQERGGLAAWLISRLRSGAQARKKRKSRLALLDRISLAPRQSLALVEADGKRFLVGTSPDSGPVFYPLDGAPASMARPAQPRANRGRVGAPSSIAARVSW